MELSLACILQRTHARANGHGLKLTAAHEPPGDVGRLQFGAFP